METTISDKVLWGMPPSRAALSGECVHCLPARCAFVCRDQASKMVAHKALYQSGMSMAPCLHFCRSNRSRRSGIPRFLLQDQTKKFAKIYSLSLHGSYAHKRCTLAGGCVHQQTTCGLFVYAVVEAPLGRARLPHQQHKRATNAPIMRSASNLASRLEPADKALVIPPVNGDQSHPWTLYMCAFRRRQFGGVSHVGGFFGLSSSSTWPQPNYRGCLELMFARSHLAVTTEGMKHVVQQTERP